MQILVWELKQEKYHRSVEMGANYFQLLCFICVAIVPSSIWKRKYRAACEKKNPQNQNCRFFQAENAQSANARKNISSCQKQGTLMERTLLSAFMQRSPAELWSSENESSCTLKAFLCFCRSHLHHICISNMHMILAKDADFYVHRSTYIFARSLFSLQGGLRLICCTKFHARGRINYDP